MIAAGEQLLERESKSKRLELVLQVEVEAKPDGDDDAVAHGSEYAEKCNVMRMEPSRMF